MKIKIAKMYCQMVAIGLSVAASIGYCVLSVGFVFSAGVAASTSPAVTLQTNILQTACTISFLDKGKAPVTTLPLDPINSSLIDRIYPTATLFYIKMSGCGVAGTKTPQVTITGINASAPDVTSGNSPGFKFRNSGVSGGTSKEYFVVVGEGPTLSYIAASTTSAGKGMYSTASPNVVYKGKVATSGEGDTQALYASVACNDKCTYAKGARAGSLIASLTFQFDYK
ncbi:hypothetical protein FCM30_06835 [Lelliottia aquatilis]|uniref:hypothetical protein n=1 Tax=Lelliottia aquatilis TaxID=2080838 RepID=UPI001576E468|nr:hypothetical protein [Lelliottia aquatilis]NTZ45477.1 hypothetical protein [Lelliottia aquatilis]